MGRVVGLDDGGGEASAVADVVAVLARPLTDPRRPLRVALAGAPSAGGAASSDASAAGDLGPELLSELPGVGVVQIDLVGHAVKSERHRLGGLAAINIVGEDYLSLARHDRPSGAGVLNCMHSEARDSENTQKAVTMIGFTDGGRVA